MKNIFILGLMMFGLNSLMFPQELKDKEINQIQQEAKNMINSYNSYADIVGDLTEDKNEREKFFLPQFIDLFISDKVMVYNDLDPDRSSGEKLPVDRYASNMMLWFPNGLKTQIDITSLQFGNVQKVEEGVFFINVNLIKYISGFFMGTSINRATNRLEFRIGFKLVKKAFSDFKITGINFIEKLNPLPEPAGQIIGKLTVIQGQKEVKFSLAPIPETNQYIWSLPEGAKGTSNTNFIVVNFDRFAKSGIISVRGRNETGEGKASTIAVIVNELPAPADQMMGKTIVYRGEKGLKYSVPVIKGAIGYEWELPAGSNGTSNTNTIAVEFTDASQTGQISVKGINQYGEGEPSVLIIKVIDKPKPYQISLTGIYGSSEFKTKSYQNIVSQHFSEPLTDNMSTLNFGVHLGYFFNPQHSLKFGIGLGFDLFNYQCKMSIDEMKDTIIQLTDKDKDVYNRNIAANQVKEELKVVYYAIPVTLKARYSLKNRIDLTFDSGIKYSIINSRTASAKGEMTSRGYYPSYNVELFGIEGYSFNEKQAFDQQGNELSINTKNLSVLVSAGISLAITRSIWFDTSFFYEKGILDISNNKSGEYHIATENLKYNSILGATTDLKLNMMGLMAGVSYKF